MQSLLERGGDYTELDNKIIEFMRNNHFFRLTEGKFYEVLPGKSRDINIKVQIKEGTITWYFANCGHDETTQEFRNQVFRSAALGHLLVPGACSKYYRGTNAMHVRRMHTSEEESKINHNHYRVHDNYVTPSQFDAHLRGFLKAQEAYGFTNKFLNEEEVTRLVKEYAEFSEQLDQKVDGGLKSLREVYHEQELTKWTQKDIAELESGFSVEEPCEAQEVIIPLNERKINILNESQKLSILPKEWVKYNLGEEALNVIAREGSAGLKSEIPQTRQIKGSSLPKRKNVYSRIGELFDKKANPAYPAVEAITV